MPSAAEWLSQLVRIPSVNPEQAGARSGPGGEERIAGLLAEWFGQLGAASVEVEQVAAGRPNVYGIWRGRSDRWVGVDVHTDTVGVETMTGSPFSGEIRDGRVWGRGSVDTKATLAIVLAALQALQDEARLPEPNIVIAATIDEEVNMLGASAFAEWMKRQSFHISELLIAEPTGCAPVHGHKGAVRFRIRVDGRSAHSAQAQFGHNAIVDAATVIQEMVHIDSALQAAAPDPLGTGTLCATIIEGGTGSNVVPDQCKLTADRRIVSRETVAAVVDELRSRLEGLGGISPHFDVLHAFEAFYQPDDSSWIQQLTHWAGEAPRLAPYGTNASVYSAFEGTIVVMGPGSIDEAHGNEEWVEISQLEKMANIYARWWGI